MTDPRQPTVLAGLVGAGIQQSRSPALHMREGAELGLSYSYELFDLDLIEGGRDALAEVLDAAERNGFAGVNVTYPCKQDVIPLLSELSEEAERLGAVNTVVFREGRRVGHNTDCWGFSESYKRGLGNVALNHAVQLGAGGAGAAVSYAALNLGLQTLTLFDPAAERARALAERLQNKFGKHRVTVGDDLPGAMAKADGLINASPVGMAKHPGLPLEANLVRPRHWIAEVIYVPLDTGLVKLGRRLGCRVLDGGGMAVLQAAMAFELFSGAKPDSERMSAHFDAMARTS